MTIKIPTWMNPYTVEINGQKYSYPAGKEIDVPNAVAEVIQRDIAAHTDTAAPQYVQPRWGKYKVPKTVVKQHNFNQEDPMGTLEVVLEMPMTAEEYAALKPDSIVNHWWDSMGVEHADVLPLSNVHWANGYLHFDNYFYVEDNGAYAVITFEIEVDAYERIPGEYLAGVAALVMSHNSESYYTANMTPAQVASLLYSGVPVVCLNTFESTGEQSAGFVTYYPDNHMIRCAAAGIPEVSADATDWNDGY